MAAEDKRPLSLNERLSLSISRSRTNSHRTSEIRVRKVKLDGRRRLCKLSSTTDGGNPGSILSPGSSSGEKSDEGGGDCNWDVLDLSSRLETLSVEKPNRSLLPAPHESEAEFKSASSSLSSSSPEERWSEGIEKNKGKAERPLVLEQGEGIYIKGVKGKAVERLVLEDDSDEDNCVFLGSCDKPNSGEIDYPVEDINVDCGDPISMNGTGKCRASRYTLPGKIAKMLYPYQRDGLKWLWSLHCGGTGGILGDDMGLGKTMQVNGLSDGFTTLFLLFVENEALT